ncbi:hypothetical protein CDD82_1739 [Ophiocordyceps australis]|uniref:Uncharacterized protein n=1 Tax=Ophiocordyceps australis TaxID=1399860 RepID=A0A2C5ZKW1_9HYPO|nr:hypothetical protein CDD82_1739 [Ophiocordyceps australis]
MAPLILHNVPDDECYVGEDGLKRPYAMIFPQHEGHTTGTRSRRSALETGSFGKSSRRSRSRPGTPGRARENPTLANADRMFGEWVSGQNAAAAASAATSSARRSSNNGNDDVASKDQQQQQQQCPESVPVEMILRGYKSSLQQYAAIARYEALAGMILEDYARDPPASQRRYKSELRDPALTRNTRLTDQERALVSRAACGEHWVKVTFASLEAAHAAAHASPQSILGYLVYAEPYHQLPPARDEACPERDPLEENLPQRHGHHGSNHHRHQSSGKAPGASSNTNMPSMVRSRLLDLSPATSRTSSQTVDSGTLSASQANTESTATVTDTADAPAPDTPFCRRIPTARRINLLPAEQALLPQPSVAQRLISNIPFLRWFGGSMIGSEVPRLETGDFDWAHASLYWKFIWWMDATFGLFGGDICSTCDKDD